MCEVMYSWVSLVYASSCLAIRKMINSHGKRQEEGIWLFCYYKTLTVPMKLCEMF